MNDHLQRKWDAVREMQRFRWTTAQGDRLHDAPGTARRIGSSDTRLVLLNTQFEGAEEMKFGK